MSGSATGSGTRKLSDVARHVVVPSGIVSTGYPAVEAKCRDLGIAHDDWQRGLGALVLAKRADGKYAATVGGVVLSIPRQVGKTFTVGSIVFALSILFPRLTVLWTAHHTRTSDETFGSMLGLSNRRKVAPHVESRRKANGQQAILFRNGSRILFGAREQGFGRGFAQVDIEVFDEAQILSERALDDMVPATNQSRHPAGALLFYMGTPPRPVDTGEVFRGKRERALSGKTQDMVYVELSADADADADDEGQWAKGNPSYPLRTPRESMLRMRENTGSDEAYLREAMGVWVKAGASEVLPGWGALDDPVAALGTSPAFAVAAAEDGSFSCLSVASRRSDGLVQLQTIQQGRGTSWLAAAVQDVLSRHRARVLVHASLRGVVPGEEIGAADYERACKRLQDDVEGERIRHHGEADAGLQTAVSIARWSPSPRRLIGSQGRDICQLQAATLALHALTTGVTPVPDIF